MIKISIKVLGVNVGNSILDNSKSDKKSEGIAKEIVEQSKTLLQR